MWSQWMFVVVAFVVSFLLTSFLFSKMVVFEGLRKREFSATTSVVLGCVVSSAVVLAFSWDEYDFISDVNVWSFLAPLIGLAVIFASCFSNRLYAVEIAVLTASIIGVFGGGLNISFIPKAPLIVNQICTIALWTIFSIGIRSVSFLSPVLQVQGVTISGGFVLLYVFGASPFMMGVVGAALLASMMAAYMNYNYQTIGVLGAPVVGYMLGWFALIYYQEMLLSCFVVLAMYSLVEIFISIVRRLTFLKKYKVFFLNSFSLQIYDSGLTPAVIVKSIWMIGGISTIFCVFQANGVNNYSIPSFVLVVVLWQFYKLLNWKNEDKSWRETKDETVSEIKETISNVVKEVRKKRKTPNKNKKGKK